jgi:Domain of unknown function (DUF4835)
MRNGIFIFIFFLTGLIQAQELDCQVQVISRNTQIADPQLFKDLENAIFEFMNNRKWTDDAFEPEEKIKCSLILTINSELSISKFRATASIQSSRPVYNSDYETVIFNHADNEWDITYDQYQPLDYSDNAFLSNLTSMLAYYAYVIVGLDYDSFSKFGGTPYFLKAQNIVTTGQSTSFSGWKSYGNTINRYWLMENLLNGIFKDYREAFYDYHINGLDAMYDKRQEATKVILTVLDKLNAVNTVRYNSMAIQVFFQAKSDELVDIFKTVSRQDQAKAGIILNRLDPSNAPKYKIFN